MLLGQLTPLLQLVQITMLVDNKEFEVIICHPNYVLRLVLH